MPNIDFWISKLRPEQINEIMRQVALAHSPIEDMSIHTYKALISGSLKITGIEDTALFDMCGRCNPEAGGVTGQMDLDPPNPKVMVQVPNLDYEKILARWKKYFPPGTKLPTLKHFERGHRNIMETVEDRYITRCALFGPSFPICLPALDKEMSYNRLLDEIFVPSVKAAYEEMFHGRKLKTGIYAEPVDFPEKHVKLSIYPESRHQQLLEKLYEGPVVAVYFCDPFRCFSAKACLQMMCSLPENFHLSGVVDAATLMIGYTDLFASKKSCLGLDTPAVRVQDDDNRSLPFCSFDSELHLRGGHGYGLNSTSAGLVVTMP